MTALLITILVKEGKLRDDMTLNQALPGIPMLGEFHNVTILDLLLNKAEIIAFQSSDYEDPALFKNLWDSIPARFPNPTQQRREIAKAVLALEPIATPGSKVIYSNVGRAIAGLIIEMAADQSYEDLLIAKIFEPLGMHTARIGGWPASAADASQPRGHYPKQGSAIKIKPQALDEVIEKLSGFKWNSS